MHPLLGEIEIELAGEKQVLKPTFKALTLIEELSGKSLSVMVKGFTTMDYGVREIASIVYGGMFGTNGNSKKGLPDFDTIGEKVIMTGLVELTAACQTIIAAAYTGKPMNEFTRAREEAKALQAGAQGEDQPQVAQPQV